MTAVDLLPSNATQLERDLSLSSNTLPRLSAATQRIRNAKREDIPDSVVPWLIYEYGLGEILPFVPDLRQALADGIQWQRVRGTRAAIDIGLGWIGFDAMVEESEAGTLRWADFQMGLDQAPNGLEFTNNVIQISRLSAPIRSRLFRIYGGYDHRRFRLDDHLLSGGSWLADDTGVYLREDWPQLSFGRQFTDAFNLTADATFGLSIERTRTDGGIYEDRNILSVSQLDELVWEPWHMEAERVTVSRGHFTSAGQWWLPPTYWADHTWDQGLDWAGLLNRIQPAQKFAKAGIYLSDFCTLSDTNTTFPCRYEEELGDGPLLLSEGDYDTGVGVLSEHLQRTEYVEWNERIDRIHPTEVVAAADAASTVTISREHQRLLPYDDTFRLDQHLLSEWDMVLDLLFKSRLHVRTVDLGIGVGGLETVSRISEAGIYLDEGAALGDSAAVLAFEFDQRFERSRQVVVTQHHNPSGFLAALDRLTQKVLSYDDTFTLDLHQLGEFPVVQDQDCITRAHTAMGVGALVRTEDWGSLPWLDGATWDPEPYLYGQLDRFHTTVVVEDRQGIAEVSKTFAEFGAATENRQDIAEASNTRAHTTLGPLEDRQSIAAVGNTRAHTDTGVGDQQGFEDRLHVRYLQGATLALFTFYAWADAITWTAEATGTWTSIDWSTATWIDGNASWNPTSPLIESKHESST